MPEPTPPGRSRHAPAGAPLRTGSPRRPPPINKSLPTPPQRSRPRQSSGSQLLTVVQQLQPRDHVIAALLVEHRTLTTSQLSAVLFDAPSTTRSRLYRLRRLGWVDRFTPVRAGRRRETHWVAGLLAARYLAVQQGNPAPTPRTWRDRVEAIAASTHLGHTTGASQVFIDLLAHARTHPDARLARWWGPARTAAAVGQRVHPDGHGVWTATRDGQDRQVGFWLEYDTGTEPLARLVAKLDPYARLWHAGGPDYPVLFHLPSPTREANLHRRLAETPQLAVTLATTTPTAVTDTADGVTGPVWRTTSSPSRVRLIDLPSAPGRPGPYHPGPPTPEQDPLFWLRDVRLVDDEPN